MLRRRSIDDLILGTVEHYDYFDFSQFLISLRRTGFPGHVCLFAGPGISDGTVRKIRRLGVEVVRYGDEFPFVTDAPHRQAPASLPKPIHVFNYRHFLYLDYLLKHGDRFGNVLITDVRDVVFQRDPFDFPVSERIHVAMENPEIPIGACPWTSGWLLAGYPAETLERLKDKELSCAGTTLAPVRLMTRYLQLMLAEIAVMKDAYECADQAAHNVLLHEGKLEPVERLRNFEGPILTVGTEPRYALNDHGELVNRDGSVIALVHQYDRHPELVRMYERKFLSASERGTNAALRLMKRVRARLKRQAGLVGNYLK